MAEDAPFDVHVEGLDVLLRRIPDDAKRHTIAMRILTRLGMRWRAEAMKRAPSRTGQLRRSIVAHVDHATMEARFTAEAHYAPFVEHGTGLYGPHQARITAPSGRVMAWPGGSTGPHGNLRQTGSPRAGSPRQTVFARSTAGMRAEPFIEPAWRASLPFLAGELRDVEPLLFREGPVSGSEAG